MKQTLPPPPHARIEDLDEGQLYTLDFCTAILAWSGERSTTKTRPIY
jgi:hypothetical protein